MRGLIQRSTPEEMWPDPLDIRYIDGHTWQLRADFRFINPSFLFPSMVIKAGEETDFASIPQALQNILSPTDRRIGKIAVVHDEFYRNPTLAISRKQADGALREGMEVLGASWFLRQTVWAFVRSWGWRAFKPRTVSTP